ncbi:MAG: hypothetical protein AAGE65_06850 [Planctomycetota bacterium]
MLGVSCRDAAFAAWVVSAVVSTGSAQVSTWDGSEADDFWFTADNWDTGLVPNAVGEAAVVGGPSPTILNGGARIDSLTVLAGGELVFDAGRSLVLDDEPGSFLSNAGSITTGGSGSIFGVLNTLDNSGAITVVGGASFSDLRLEDHATLTGGGTLTLDGERARVTGIALGLQLTIEDQTIQGEGSLGANALFIANESGNVIDANVSGGTLLLDVRANGLPGESGFTNDGTLRASNGGFLELSGNSGGEFDNNGGVIEALMGSEVRFDDSSAVRGGLIRSVGTGVIRANPEGNVARTSFFDVTFDADVVAENDTLFGIGGTIENRGTIAIQSAGNGTELEIQDGGATLTGGGTVVLVGPDARVVDITGTQTLTIADQTIEGQGALGSNTIKVQIEADGLVHANASGGVLLLDPANVAGEGEFSNAGTVRASSGARIELSRSGSGSFANSGTMEALTNGAITSDADLVNTGTIRAEGNGTATFTGGTLDNQGAVEAFNGAIVTVQSGADLPQLVDLPGANLSGFAPDGEMITGGEWRAINGTLNVAPALFDATVNRGDIYLAGTQTVVDLFREGTAGRSASRDFVFNEGSFVIDDGFDFVAGRVFGSGSVPFGDNMELLVEGIPVFENEGTLLVGDGSTLEFQQRSFTFQNLSPPPELADVNVRNVGVIGGSGTLLGDILNEGGVVAPGMPDDPTATLTIDGRLRLQANVTPGTLAIDIAGPGDHDQLAVLDDLVLGGLLEVDLADNYTPGSGDQFAIATATNGVSGVFANAADGDTVLTEDGQTQFDVAYTATQVILFAFRPFLPGDFNDSGQVEQGDLNLVLNNWGGQRGFPSGDDWANAIGFATDLVDQEELNAVLNNWGDTNAPSLQGFSVPEPSIAPLAAMALGLLNRRAR